MTKPRKKRPRLRPNELRARLKLIRHNVRRRRAYDNPEGKTHILYGGMTYCHPELDHLRVSQNITSVTCIICRDYLDSIADAYHKRQNATLSD